MKKKVAFKFLFFSLSPYIFSQDSVAELNGRIAELESLVNILQSKLVEVDQYKYLLFAIVGLIFFLMIIGTNASFKRSLTREMNRIKRELLEKYRESISLLIIEEDKNQIDDMIKQISQYNEKSAELALPEKNYSPGDWLIRGLYLYYDGQYSESVNVFERALFLNPDYTEAYFNLAVVYSVLDKPKKAVESYEKAILRNPQLPVAYCNMGIELEKLNRNEEAVEAFNKAIELKPDYPKAYQYMGSDLRKLERKEEAVQTYNKMGDTLLRMGREEEAIEAYNNMALDLIKLGLEEKDEDLGSTTEPDLDLEGLGKEQENLKIYYNQGNEFSKCGRYDEAIEAYNHILKIKPDDMEACFCKAKTLVKIGKDEEAVEVFKFSINQNPDSVRAHYFMGKVLMRMGSEADAVEAFNRVIELKPDYPETYHKLACFYAKHHNFDEMLSYLRSYLELAIEGTEEHVEKDDTFEHFREDPRFQELMTEFKSYSKEITQ
ncbi:MAG: tetratricopeptide repeat protein [Spirochaetaceae bacterium]|nr:tetratricopeptide repeat protein [Spirochaetaceae bacterium]